MNFQFPLMTRIILCLALWLFFLYNSTTFSTFGNNSSTKLFALTICCSLITFAGIPIILRSIIRISVKWTPRVSPLAPATSVHSYKYDVFLSYTGETRRSFTDHLYKGLQKGGIKVFRDKQLERGTALSSKLLTAIEDSKFAIVVISPNYASSLWCLSELSTIFETKASGTILPVFYGVKPSDIRCVRGTFARVFMKHEHRNITVAQMQEWRSAFSELGFITGWVSKDRYVSSSSLCCLTLIKVFRARLLAQNEIHQEYKSGDLRDGIELYVEISIPLRYLDVVYLP